MLVPTLLLGLAATPSPQSVPTPVRQAPVRQDRERGMRMVPGYGTIVPPGWRPRGQTIESFIVGSPVSIGPNGDMDVPSIPLDMPGLYPTIRVPVPSTGAEELLLLQQPGIPPPAKVPLLIGYHGFGVSHADVPVNTTFLDEAMSRGWYVIAPISWSSVGDPTVHFSSVESQQNTLAGIQWVLENFNIDRDRVYGVGFSMGGGMCTSFAARHLDPDGPMFAAIVNHTGTVALRDVYLSETQAAQNMMEALFGGPPTTHLFEYQRSSVIDLDPNTLALNPGVDVARNLVHIPVQTWYATLDPIVYLRLQSERFHEQMQAYAGSDSSIFAVPSNQHTWANLPEDLVCDWMDLHTLTRPTGGPLMVDRDGRFHDMWIVQDGPGAFTPLFWDVDLVGNRFSLALTENLTRVTTDIDENGFDLSQPFELVMGTDDNIPDQVVFTSYDLPPIVVTRDGGPATGWFWNGLDETLTITETDGAYHLWRFVQ